MLDLVSAALGAKLAVDLGDRASARASLAELGRLLPLAKVAVQNMATAEDDHEPRELAELIAEKYSPTTREEALADERA